MIEKPYTVRTAVLSNGIAFAFTGTILGIWYFLSKDMAIALWACGILLGLVAVIAVIERALIYWMPEREKIDISLKSDANQWAPIAGASLIVGWSALKTNFATHEGSLLILIGLLYSLWCIVLAMEARQSHRIRTASYLFISHLIVPAVIGLGLAHVVNILTSPTPEEVRQGACDKARMAFSENQCKPIEPLDFGDDRETADP